MTSSNRENNRRIAKNTGLLYFRMILVMGVSLYTTRIILKILGVEDFGIYNVVGGIVTMLGFLSSSMSSAIQRFLAFEYGKNNLVELNRVFSMSINIQIIIALGIIIVSETIGLWFLNNHLTIPESRMSAANWIYQLSILTFIVNIISIPYDALILTYEKMSVFAYVSIVEVILKLLVVYILELFWLDKLILYPILILLVSILVRSIYYIYVKRNISNCKYHFFWDRSLFKPLFNFAAWSLWGNLAVVAYNQGINILLNIFFGPIVNAARAITFQVNAALNSFVSNFQMALKPQIIKAHASNQHSYMEDLILSGSRFSFFLMLILCLPFIISTPLILEMWLGTVPEKTVVFCRLILFETIINSLSGSLMTGAQASGKIKLYQTVIGGILLLNLPISFLLLYFGFPPESTMIVSLIIAPTALFVRLYLLPPIIMFSRIRFLKEVVKPVGIISILITLIILLLAPYYKNNLSNAIFANTIIISITIVLIFIIGLKFNEREMIKLKLLQLQSRLKKKPNT